MEVYASLALCVALGHHSNLLFICHEQASSLLKCADICSRYHPLSQGFVSSRVSKNGCCCFRRNEEVEAQTPPPFDRNDRLCLFQGTLLTSSNMYLIKHLFEHYLAITRYVSSPLIQGDRQAKRLNIFNNFVERWMLVSVTP